MDYLMFVVLIAILAVIIFKNFTLFLRAKFNRKYIALYRKMLTNPLKSYDEIVAFLKEEKNEEYRTKIAILKMECELLLSKDYKETFEIIDYSNLFETKNKIDHKKININSESFIFILMTMFKLKECNDYITLEDIKNKMKQTSGIEERLEYAMVENTCEYLKGDKNKVSFYNKLLEGNYTEYRYDKQMVGLFKRFSQSILAYDGQNVEDYEYELQQFAKSTVGHTFLEQIGIYDRFKEEETK